MVVMALVVVDLVVDWLYTGMIKNGGLVNSGHLVVLQPEMGELEPYIYRYGHLIVL
jgi:hypothetical protein